MPILTLRLWGKRRVYLIDKLGCRDVGVSPKKISSVCDLKIIFSPDQEKKKKEIFSRC